MSWDAVEGATRYYVYQSEELLGSITGTSVDIYDLESDTRYCFTVAAVVDNVESDKSEEVCETTLKGEGIAELASSLNIYPNPVSDVLFVEAEMNIEEVVVYDVYGRRQVAETPSHQEVMTIEVSSLNSGVYFVKVKTENGEVVKRFVKK